MTNTVYIGLGSNLKNPVQQLQRALSTLQQSANINHLASSPFYASKPLGPQDQPDYINAVAKFTTLLTPLLLLDFLQKIEQQQGRIRGRHWGERTLDLDILLYNELSCNHPRLKIPHPELPQRIFVLIPLSDIAPSDLVIPKQSALAILIKECPHSPLQRLPFRFEV